MELSKRWNNPGARNLAEEILLSAVRQVRSLGSLGPTLLGPPDRSDLDLQAEPSRAARPPAVSPISRACPSGKAERKESHAAEVAAGKARASKTSATPAPVDDEYTYETDSEEEVVKKEREGFEATTTPKAGSPVLPGGVSTRVLDPHRDDRNHRSPERKDKKRKKDKKCHRAGRKHQRIGEKPEGALVHRSLGREELRFRDRSDFSAQRRHQ